MAPCRTGDCKNFYPILGKDGLHNKALAFEKFASLVIERLFVSLIDVDLQEFVTGYKDSQFKRKKCSLFRKTGTFKPM